MADGSGFTGTRYVPLTVRGPHKEQLVKRWLENAGFEVELPVEVRRFRGRHGSRKRGTVERPAIRGYVFLIIPEHIGPGDELDDYLNRARAVHHVGSPIRIRRGGKPVILQARWLDELNVSLLDPDGLLTPEYVPEAGEKITLNGAAGHFSGRGGYVESVTERDVRVIIETLTAALRMTVPRCAVRRAA